VSSVFVHFTTIAASRIDLLLTSIGRRRYDDLSFYLPKLTKSKRCKYPELSVASYNKNSAASNEPDGIVAVWNLHLLERPEFVFHSQVRGLSLL
jgi:hypothetical protein